MTEDYFTKQYFMECQESNDKLTVRKYINSDWLTISILTNDEFETQIEIRSEEMASQLHFILGRLLS